MFPGLVRTALRRSYATMATTSQTPMEDAMRKKV
jgi:hypothetical protein